MKRLSARKKTPRLAAALLAGAVLVSLAGCGPAAGGASGGAESAVPGGGDAPTAQASAAGQGRWVESEPEGVPAGLTLFTPARLDDGTLVALARDDSADLPPVTRLISADDGVTWQAEPTTWAEDTGWLLSAFAARGDGTLALAMIDLNDADPRGARTVHLCLAGADGALTELPLPAECAGLYAMLQLCFLPDGTLAASCTADDGASLPGNVLFYDVEAGAAVAWAQTPQGGDGMVSVGGIRLTGPAGMLPGADADGTPFLYYVTDSGDLGRADLDGSTTTLEPGFLPVGATHELALDPGGGLCYADDTGIYRRAPGGSLTEQVVDAGGTVLSLENNFVDGFAVAADGSYLVTVLDNTSYTNRLYRYTFDETLAAATETLEVWSLGENATVRSAVQAFAQAHPECETVYSPAVTPDGAVTTDDALRTLNTELLAGEGPDVLILDGADLDAFAESGLLADLSAAVDTGALYDFIAGDYTQADGSVPLLPARFTVPLVHGAPGTLDGVATLDDIAALVHAYAPRPAETSYAPLSEGERYAFGFECLDDVVQFALQTSQPAVLRDGGLDGRALQSLLGFIGDVGEYYGMAAWPPLEYVSGVTGSFGGLDAVTWGAGMSEYVQVPRAVFGYGSMDTPSWLGAISPDMDANGQTILQPGLCEGVYLPSCFVAVSANSDAGELALDFAAVLFSDAVQGVYLSDGLPVTETGGQVYLDRNRAELEDKGYTGGFEEILAQLSTPVVVDGALLQSLATHAAALVGGEETLDAAVSGVQGDLALRFAEGR